VESGVVALLGLEGREEGLAAVRMSVRRWVLAQAGLG
jgi:hypothetical protein